MTADQLRKSILQQAIQGKLVPQDSNDEPASALLERIREEKARLIKEKKAKREKNPSMIFRGEDNSYYEEFPATGEVRCIDDEIPFDLPDGWVWVRVRDLGEVVTGGTPAKENPSFYGREYPLYKPSDLDQGLDTRRALDMLSEEGFRKTRQLPVDSLLVTCIGSLGKVGLIKCVGSCNQQINAVIPLRDLVVSEYLYFVCSSEMFQSILKGKSASTTIAIVNKSRFSEILLPLPPLAEQERIVAKIEELMPWVEQYGKAQSELDQLNDSIQGRLRKSVLQYAIEGKLVPQQAEDGSAEELLAEIQAEKQRLYATGKLKKKDLAHSTIFRAEDGMYYEQVGKTITCIDEEIPFDLPESWRWVRFGEITRFSIGKTPERGNQAYWFNGQYPWVAISDMPATGVITRTKEWISQDAVSKCFREIVPKGSLLMSFKLTIGRTSILQMDAYHNEAIISIPLFVDFNDAFRNYLLHVLPIIANMGASKDAIKGKTLNSQSIHNLLLPLPPLAEQQRIVSKLEEVISVLNRLGQ